MPVGSMAGCDLITGPLTCGWPGSTDGEGATLDSNTRTNQLVGGSVHGQRGLIADRHAATSVRRIADDHAPSRVHPVVGNGLRGHGRRTVIAIARLDHVH